jgi:hypothetical protein
MMRANPITYIFALVFAKIPLQPILFCGNLDCARRTLDDCSRIIAAARARSSMISPLTTLTASVRSGRERHGEIGCRLVRAAWGRGIASEAAQVLLRHAFDTVRLPRIIADITAENVGSLNVAAKLRNAAS